MNNKKLASYGNLCSLFYDATKKYASEQEVEFYTSFIEYDQGRVLEAMSGSGRLLIPIMQRNYIIDGVDNSSIMLDRCRERCGQLKLAPILYEQSIEELRINQTYQTVIIAVGSFQLIIHRTDALRALTQIRRHMHIGGSLLIDIFVLQLSNAQSVQVVRIDHQRVIRLSQRYIFYEQEKRAESICFYELIVNGMVQQGEQELIEVTWYTDSEIDQMLNQAGFEMIQVYDESFSRDSVSRIVFAKAV